ncbi:MAG: bifunctional pyr operon transcriptional regulator/uracil phosphoribosyltransferase PyrR [Bilophila sp.]
MKTTTLLHADEISRIIDRLACQIIERHDACEKTVILGIQRRGVDIAIRLCAVLEEKLGHKLPFGTLDINLYRDDWTTLHTRPTIGESHIPTPLDNKNVILVDDVLFSGRTIRAALEAILDYGRPSQVELLVLVDRGHRELPIHGDYVGRKVNTARSEKVNVLMEERDGRDEVELQSADD